MLACLLSQLEQEFFAAPHIHPCRVGTAFTKPRPVREYGIQAVMDESGLHGPIQLLRDFTCSAAPLMTGNSQSIIGNHRVPPADQLPTDRSHPAPQQEPTILPRSHFP